MVPNIAGDSEREIPIPAEDEESYEWLPRLSSVVKGLKAINQRRIYADEPDDAALSKLRGEIKEFTQHKKKIWRKYKTEEF